MAHWKGAPPLRTGEPNTLNPGWGGGEARDKEGNNQEIRVSWKRGKAAGEVWGHSNSGQAACLGQLWVQQMTIFITLNGRCRAAQGRGRIPGRGL